MNIIREKVKQINWIKKSYWSLLSLKRKMYGLGVSENVNRTAYTKNCLILYIVSPFRNGIHHHHQNSWQAVELAKIVGEFGYNVDVINFDDSRTKLKKKYDMVIDLHPGLHDQYKNAMNPGCIKIAYMTGSSLLFSNKAEAQRIENVQKRRGVLLKARRYGKPFNIEQFKAFDAMLFIGNKYNLKSYEGHMPKRVFFIKNTGHPFLNQNNFTQKDLKSFVFFSGGGCVHKGLDLLLEVFSKETDKQLYVCTNFSHEKDFTDAYQKELFHTPNIHPIGFIDIESEEFRKIAQKCAFALLPSCSEANAGSVLTALSAGIVPIVSRECGFEDDEVYYFEDCSIDTISRTVNEFSKKSKTWLEERARWSMKVANERYSKEAFSDSVRQALAQIVK